MAKITVLDQATINQIAAGEVVERPASVVKELIENAMDAKATAITVEIKEGGIGFIRITDNGMGIPKDEIKLAFLRHSTSKITCAEDLITVSSLGFRGEALSSISAVSQIELITKTKSSLTGALYVIEGGEEISLEEIGAPDGTTFIVKNLFYNTPARRKFLKSPATEGAYINDLLERMALSRPDISFRFISNGKNKLYTSGNGKLKDVIYTIYGREITSNLIEVKQKERLIKVEGFIGKPVIARGNRSFENYYINGRYIKSGLIAKAIETAYKPFMMLHKYPFTVLHFQIDSTYIDVNVHPTKMELRFKEEESLLHQLHTILSDALLGKEFIPEITLSNRDEKKAETYKTNQIEQKKIPEPFEEKRWQIETGQKETLLKTPLNTEKNSLEIAEEEKENDKGKEVAIEQKENDKGKEVAIGEEENDRIKDVATEEKEKDKSKETLLEGKESDKNKEIDIEQNLKTDDKTKEESYRTNLVDEKFPVKEKTSIVKESSTYYDSKEQLSLFSPSLLSTEGRKKHKIIGQVFDTYWIIQMEDKMFIVDQHAAHEKVLYEKTIKDLKEKQVVSQMISPPTIVSLSSKEESLFQTFQQAFTEIGFEIEAFGGREYAIRSVPANLFGIDYHKLFFEMLDGLEDSLGTKSLEIITDKVASISCKAAVKGNMSMNHMEMDALIEKLMELENPYACPHGRPTIISMSKYELEKKFKRIV